MYVLTYSEGGEGGCVEGGGGEGGGGGGEGGGVPVTLCL